MWSSAPLRHRRNGALVLGGLVALFLGHVAVQSLVVSVTVRDAIHAAYAAASIAGVSWAVHHVVPKKRGSMSIPILAGGGALAFFSLLLLFAGAGWWTAPGGSSLDISFVEIDMLASWNTPADVAYGSAFTGASFGLLPRYLEAYGHRTRIVDSIDSEVLANTDLVVIINPGGRIGPGEHDILWSYVRSGGGLVVLGDHTDVGGVMGGVNALLEPAGIGLRFDSAVAARHDWRFALNVASPLSMAHVPAEVHVSIGASVEAKVSLLTTPLLTGTAAFSDPGNRTQEANAYLGNLSFDRGERYGEIPLAITRAYGEGRIALFGDTSEFQNSAMPYSAAYVLSMFEWIADGPPAWCDAARTILAALWILLTPIALRRTGDRGVAGIAALFLVASLAGSWSLSSRLALETPRDAGWAVVDMAHNQRVSTRALDDASLDGLLVSLGRAGYLPQVVRERPLPSLGTSDLYVSIGAGSPLRPAEATNLERDIAAGAHALVATQWPTAQTAWPWLKEIGLTVRNIPLGLSRPTVGGSAASPQFGATWALEPDDTWTAIATVTLDEHSFVVASARQLGAGGVTVVGDVDVFLTASLENRGEYVPENLEFLEHLLERGPS